VLSSSTTYSGCVKIAILTVRWHCVVWLLYELTVIFRDGKEPSLIEFGSVRVLPNIRVCLVRVLSSYGKMKVGFWFGCLCGVVGCIWFGSVRVLIHIYLIYMFRFTIFIEYTVWVKKSTGGFLTFSPNGWEFLVQILLAYYFFIYTKLHIFINYLQLWRSHAILSATTQRAYRPMVILSIWCELGGCV